MEKQKGRIQGIIQTLSDLRTEERKLSRIFRYKRNLLLLCETAFFSSLFFTAQHLNKVAVNYGWRGRFVSAVVQLSVLQKCGTSCSNSYMYCITPVYSLSQLKKRRK